MSPVPLMERREERKPWGLIVVLVITASAGLVSLPLQFATFRNLDTASRDDVLRSQQLIEQVRMLEEMNSANVDDHRHRNQQDHDDICRLIYEVIQASPTLREKGIRPCAARDPEQPLEGALPSPTP